MLLSCVLLVACLICNWSFAEKMKKQNGMRIKAIFFLLLWQTNEITLGLFRSRDEVSCLFWRR